jgi:hypothetical protein
MPSFPSPASSDPILGRPDKGDWRRYEVKGNLVAARARYITEHWGKDALADVARRLEGPARALFQSEVLPFAWYSMATLAEIDTALIQGPMGGDVSKMKEFGWAVGKYDLSTLYKVLFKLGSPGFIVKRVGVVYGTYIRGGGELVGTGVADGHARVTLTKGVLPRYFCSHGVPGWFSAALELSGGAQVDVRETECLHEGGTRCLWDAKWT